MSADIVQAQYEQLEQIAARFAAAAETQQVLLQRVNQRVDVLRQGGWQGKGVAAFLREMDGEVGPAQDRLIDALHTAGQTTTAISMAIREAEAYAASAFQDGRGGIDESDRVEIPKQPNSIFIGDFIVRDPSRYSFTDSYLRTLKGSHFSGENTPQLNRAMEQLLTDNDLTEHERNKLLDRIADMRGRSRLEFREEYQRFCAIRSQAAHPNEIANINRLFHGNHLGSTNSLRFGKVVGEVFGIDPVFGSLLNPTGGLPGSNNWAYPFSGNDPLGLHSVAHDAAGFLFHQYELGPGYNYLGLENDRNPNDPLTGQRSGIKYWIMEQSGLGSTYRSLPEPITNTILPSIDRAWSTYEVAEGSITTVTGAFLTFEGVKALNPGMITEGGDHIKQGLDRFGQGIQSYRPDIVNSWNALRYVWTL